MHPTLIHRAFSDQWWRFPQYEVRNGYIRPKPGQLDWYQPWSDYREPRGKGATQQPYHSLLDLTRKLQAGEISETRRDAEIAAWCSQHGLLGSLLHWTDSVTFAQEGAETSYVRISDRWKAYQPAGAVIRELREFQFQSEEALGWLHFFPDCGNKVPPPPFSEEFLNSYAEPVTSFLEDGRRLLDAVEQLTSIRDSRRPLDQKQHEFMNHLRHPMDPLMRSIQPMIYLERAHRYGLRWSCGSLLASFAMMASLDLTKSRVLVCGNPTCRAFVTSNSAEARYCSARCRGTVQMRKYRRDKAREEKRKERKK